MIETSGFLINKDSASIFLIDRLDLPFDPVLFSERIQVPITLDQHDLFQMPGLFIPESTSAGNGQNSAPFSSALMILHRTGIRGTVFDS